MKHKRKSICENRRTFAVSKVQRTKMFNEYDEENMIKFISHNDKTFVLRLVYL